MSLAPRSGSARLQLLKDMDLLKTVLPDHIGARELNAAAARFLAAANSK